MQFIGFRIEDSEFVIPILTVQEIIKTPYITAVPQAALYVKGVANLRGSIIPILSLKQVMSIGVEGNEKNVVVLATIKNTYGILVDDITGVISIEQDQIERPQEIINSEIKAISAVAKLKDRIVIILNPEKIINNIEGTEQI